MLAEAILREAQALLTGGHFVLTSGRHAAEYVNKDALYPHTEQTAELCEMLAAQYSESDIDVVVAPALGGIVLTQRVAEALSSYAESEREVLAVYAEKETKAVPHLMHEGNRMFIETGAFVIKRGYDRLVSGKRVLVVEDVLTTGGSVKKVVEVVRAIGGEVIGVGALVNRGGVTAGALGVPKFDALVDISMESWSAGACPLCATGVPINTEVGKGKEFLSQKV